MTDCQHHEFNASVAVARLEDSGRFMAEIRVSCKQCGTPFQFLGLDPGVDLNGARCSIDALEAHIAIAPQGRAISPLQNIVMSINGHNA